MPFERLKPISSLDKDRLNQLKELIPEAFADGKINWDTLREVLDEHLENTGEDAEHFGLTWPGKKQARKLATIPSKGTLVPVPGEGINEETTENIFIEGDNLEVLKLLQKSYAGRVKLIYIDPPYNTGNDFIYKDNFEEPTEDYLRKTKQMDEEGNLLTTNTKTDGRFHSNWLNMMYPRLRLARNFLREDGVIFISIDENEVHNLRQIGNEIFGEENFISSLIWQKSKKGDSKLIAQTHEYILIFARDKEKLLEKNIWRRKKAGVDQVLDQYEKFKQAFNNNHENICNAMKEWYVSLPENDDRRAHKHYRYSDNKGLYFAADFAGPDDGRTSRPRYEIMHPITGKPCKKPSTGWRWDEERTKAALDSDPPLIHFGKDETTIPCRKSYLSEIDSEPFSSVFYRDGRSATLELETLVGKGLMDFPKNTDVLKEFIQIINCSDALILDFFAGSGTIAQAVLESNIEDGGNRKFLCVQLPEPISKNSNYRSISCLAKERIRKVCQNLLKTVGLASNILDIGFKVFKFKLSNFKTWQDYKGEDTKQIVTLFSAFESPLSDDWQEKDVLVEVMLLEGFPLTSFVSKAEFTRNKIYQISSNFCSHKLYVCLETEVWEETINQVPALLLTEDIFICLDNALTDESKTELANKCNLKTI